MIQLKIDPEFRDKIPPMPEEDFNGLREDILRDGYVRDPLVVWKEENILLDGHHRWRVIQENQDILADKFSVDYKSFSDRWACIAWICANQLHKHNMTELQRMKLIQEEHDARQKSWGGDRKSSGEIHHLKSDEPEKILHGSPGKELKTRPTIAREHGITESEVKTAVEVGRGIDKAEEVSPGFKQAVLSGEVKARKSDLAALRNMEPEQRKDVAEAILESPEKAKETIQKYKEPVSMESMNATPIDNTATYNADDFKEQVGAFPKEVDDMIRLYLLVHGDMVSIPECKKAFRKALLDIKKVADKYFTEVTNS